MIENMEKSTRPKFTRSKKTNETNISITPLLEPSIEKPRIYASFYARSIATLIDLLIMSIVLFPFFTFISAFLYGEVTPGVVIEQVSAEISANVKENASANSVELFKNNQRINDYFFINHGLVKAIFEQLFQFIVLGGVFLLFWSKKQATIGQICLSMKIVDAKTLGKPTNKQLVIRLFGCVLSTLVFFLGILWIIFDPKKQGWHDKLAHTLVIKDKKTAKTI